MNDTPEYIQKFVRFLHDANWHRSLLNAITDFLDTRRYSLSQVDALIMSVTKTVEISLRDAVSRYQGSSVPKDLSYGVKLLNYAVKCGLIQDYKEPIYALLYWILKEPRNTSHHEFISYPYNTLVLFLSEANEAVERIENMIESTYKTHFKVTYDEESRKIKIENAKILRPNGTPLPADQKVEASIKFPDKTTKTLPLNHNGNHWSGEYDARGQACGTISIYLEGINHGKHFIAPSASTIMVSPLYGEACPKCGRLIDAETYICPNCGNRLRVI